MVDREVPDPRHAAPDGVAEATVAAVGKLSEALETVERARGMLYSFHQLIGHADLMLDEAVALFRAAGHPEFATEVTRNLIGRNVVEDSWTFQLVEQFDDGYWEPFRDTERRARHRFMAGRRHVYEARMRARRAHLPETGPEFRWKS